MNEEQQDLAWACLPKDARDRIKIAYKSDYVSDRGYQPTRGMEVLQNVFGFHNLTSDTEPKKVMEIPLQAFCSLCADADDYINEHLTGDSSYEYYQGRSDALHELASYKCLPDKEPPVQGEPKFKIGDKVRTIKDGLIWYVAGFTDEYIILGGENGCIKEFSDFIQYDKSYKTYRFTKFQYLEPYTEPNTKVVNEARQIAEESVKCLREMIKEKPTPRFSKGDSVLHIPTQIVYDVEEYLADFEGYKLSRMSGVATCFAKESDLETYNEPETKEPDNRQALYDALCELESASIKVRKALISM